MARHDDLTPLLYAGRHTGYGSYVLRARHDRHLTWGILVSAVVVGAVFVGPYLHQLWTRSQDEAPIPVLYDRVINYSELSAPPPIEATTPVVEQQLPKKQVKYTKPVVKPDEEVEDEELMPTMEEIRNTAVGATDIEGVGDSIAYDTPPVVEEPPPPPPRSEPFTVVETMPAFPGGDRGLIDYLGKELRYPSMAVQAEIQGVVYVQFTIGTDGRVTDERVLRGIGGGCDEEALRVIKAMPDWSPGEQRGNRVPVRMVLPIKFTLK